MTTFNITFVEQEQFEIGLTSGGDNFSAVFDSVISNDTYKGSYSVTPTTQAQELETKGLLLTENIQVAAIPSNYGLIGWNGAILTVS